MLLLGGPSSFALGELLLDGTVAPAHLILRSYLLLLATVAFARVLHLDSSHETLERGTVRALESERARGVERAKENVLVRALRPFLDFDAVVDCSMRVRRRKFKQLEPR